MADTKYFRSFYQLLEKEPALAMVLYQKHGNIDGSWMFDSFILFPTKTAFAKYVLEKDRDYYNVREATRRLDSPNPLKFLNFTKFADALIKDWGWRVVFPFEDGSVLLTDYD